MNILLANPFVEGFVQNIERTPDISCFECGQNHAGSAGSAGFRGVAPRGVATVTILSH
jgi:hypothetical protein